MKKVGNVNPRDNFDKQAGQYIYDDMNDELMMYCLELYPSESKRFFGRNNEKKKQLLKSKLRDAMNKASEDEMMNASGGGRKFFKGLGRTIARAALVVPRGAALALIRLNFRGVAKRLALLNQKGKEKIALKWKDLGGKTDKLNAAIKAGKDKHILACGKKCRARAGANVSVGSEIKDDFANLEPASTTALISSGGAIVAALIKSISDKSNYNNQKDLMLLNAEINAKQKEQDAIDATMTPSERKIAEEIIKAQNSSLDPVEAIRNNPNLTAEEKEAAIKSLNEVSGGGIDKKKIIVIGSVLLALGALAFFMFKNKSE